MLEYIKVCQETEIEKNCIYMYQEIDKNLKLIGLCTSLSPIIGFDAKFSSLSGNQVRTRRRKKWEAMITMLPMLEYRKVNFLDIETKRILNTNM